MKISFGSKVFLLSRLIGRAINLDSYIEVITSNCSRRLILKIILDIGFSQEQKNAKERQFCFFLRIHRELSFIAKWRLPRQFLIKLYQENFRNSCLNIHPQMPKNDSVHRRKAIKVFSNSLVSQTFVQDLKLTTSCCLNFSKELRTFAMYLCIQILLKSYGFNLY